jgi:hypothetical protein
VVEDALEERLAPFMVRARGDEVLENEVRIEVEMPWGKLREGALNGTG